MLKILVKKQLYEIFKGYFYNAKKNCMRSGFAVACWFIFFIAIMVLLLGGIFGVMAFGLCLTLTELGLDWMYFLFMGLITVLLGTFGSVFNTFAGLYLSKDNDLLLSLPIPVRTIVISRLINVYIMGAMYASVVILPTYGVYFFFTGFSITKLVCALLSFFILTGFVMLLSCILGLLVAKISLKLKRKGLATVLVSLLFFAAYYAVSFKLGDIINLLLSNAVIYGERVKDSAYLLYKMGCMGYESIGWALLALGIILAMLTAVWILQIRSFTTILSASSKKENVVYVEKRAKEKSPFVALLAKEFSRLLSSPNYMLNCALSSLFIPVAGVVLLVMGDEIFLHMNAAFGSVPNADAVFICGILCLLAAMNAVAVPSISLEGRSLWIIRSLPVNGRQVLWAKATMEILLGVVPMAFAWICSFIVLDAPLALKLMVGILPMIFVVSTSISDTAVAIKTPILTWTNEVEPIKHSGGVFASLIGEWILGLAFMIVYMVVGYRLGATAYMVCWAVAMTLTALVSARWLNTRGVRLFQSL